MDEMNILEKQMLENMENLKKLGVECYKYNFEFTHTIKELIEKKDDFLDKDIQVKIAGRIVSERKHGKVIFWDIKDQMEKIQLYIKKDVIGEKKFEEIKYYDLGDIIGVTGKLFKTHSGELTLFVSEVEILSKSLKPLPEKFHGLKDVEIRYRKRYLDLIVNDESKKVFLKRTQIINGIRDFLNSKGFVEVETPILQPIYGGAFAQPFVTHHNAHDMTLYLRIANELYLKRLIVGGINRVYEFAKDFRNEGIDRTHNPEFTQVEFYQAYADYNDMMELVEDMFLKLVPEKKIIYQGKEISFEKPWKRVDFYESLSNVVGEDLKGVSVEKLKSVAKKFDVDIEGKKTFGKVLDELFSELVQKKIVQPTFIINHPIEISPLARKHREKEGVVERFEAVVFGMEIGNSFSELNDPLDQKERFLKQIEERKLGDVEAFVMDEDYVDALMYGMPPTGGVGIGIDRTVMLLTDQDSIRDVVLFPLLKPEK
ncbi:MAG: lysine--tRNA ligase [bacterium]|uniref:Lysine--tRNA ligase n=2 Tax=Bacteria candidate phyla TaxID=1783234 RepID=A0A117M738_UNCT6|nr:MAG: Lysine--tRNA ligase [candidate division TA06 bacterium 32_111]KUK87927.1 MAG: Lysine--tRNA ligase [candidate division TA06 bacterium 34_109]MDI6700544.1 lysine--tRNA ligase [bacterium]HAF08080.1 lysine--tRNA ligase [candidate division WOR-3 bacterium]HCP16219.1 lysine--tRNA ligase [candidate division WOR-3 bacterium]